MIDDEVRLARAARVAGIGILEWDLATGRIAWSEGALALWGLVPGNRPRDSEALLAAVHAADRARFGAALAAARGSGSAFELDLRIGQEDPPARWLNLRAAIDRDGAGVVRGIACICVDVSGHHAARRTLQQRERQLRLVLETVPDAMVVIDEAGIVRSFSRAAERSFGYRAEEVVGRNVAMLMPPPDRDRHDGYIARYLATGQRHIIGIGRVVNARHADGRIFPAQLTVGEVAEPDGGRLFTGFLHDLSERRATQARMDQLRAELLHVSRLGDMGQLATTLAHELNQPLTAAAAAVRAAGRLLDQHGPDPSALREAITLAAEQVLRAGQIVRRLRSFIDKGHAERRREDLAKVIEDALALALVGAAERGVQAEATIAPGLPAVLIDRVQVQQVLVNLVRNAIDAMGSGGGMLRITATKAGAMVEIAVEDSGPGLDSRVAARLFEPFVTSKPDGMGVGLSICRGIVEAHGGTIGAEPRPGGGTIFRFTLPPAPA